jgi:hypothetical protein
MPISDLEDIEPVLLCVEVKSGVKKIPLIKHKLTGLIAIEKLEDYVLLRHLLFKFDSTITETQYSKNVLRMLSEGATGPPHTPIPSNLPIIPLTLQKNLFSINLPKRTQAIKPQSKISQ